MDNRAGLTYLRPPEKWSLFGRTKHFIKANISQTVAFGVLMYANCLIEFRSFLNELYEILRMRSG